MIGHADHCATLEQNEREHSLGDHIEDHIQEDLDGLLEHASTLAERPDDLQASADQNVPTLLHRSVLEL